MPSLTGAINGSDALLYMFDPSLGPAGEWRLIAGQLSNDHASTVALIEMTNKDSDGSQEFLENEGLFSMSDTLALVFSSEASFAAFKQAHRTKASRNFFWARGSLESGGGTDVFYAMVPTLSESAPNEALVTASATLQSTNHIESLAFGVLYDSAIDVNSDDAVDVSGNAAVAVAA